MKSRLQRGQKAIGSAQLLSYGVALLSVALALKITLLLGSWISATPTQLFFVAVMVSAWYGGMGPGLLATILSTLAVQYFFLETPHTHTANNLGPVVQPIVFTIAALLISGLNESLRIALRREQKLRAVSEVAQSEVQAAKERLEMVLSSINDAFFVLDRNWQFTYGNNRYCQMVKMQREDLIGRNNWDVFPDVVGTDVYVQFQRAMDEQIPVQFEYFYDPWNRWYENKVYPSPRGLTVLVTDITDRKQAAEALRQSEERFQAFMNHSPAAAWITDRDGRILYLSQSYFRTFQFPTEDVIGKTVFDIYPTHIAQQFVDNIQHAADTHAVVETTEVAPCSDGTMGNFLVYKFPIADESGETLVGGVAVDITERTRAEAALRESEELKQRILESSHDCIKVLALNGQFLYMNSGGINLFEVDDPTSLINADWVSFWQGEDQDNAKAAIATAKMGNVSQFRGYCPTAKGKPKWWDVIVTPIRDASGQVVQLLSISRDVTQQKQVEAERERLLQREQAAREEAESANRIKDEFLAVLSHELRSPLNPILGWASLLRKGRLDAAKTALAVETIERNAKLQVQLIEDLLDVSRILRGKLSLNMVPVDLAATIQAALETVRLAAEAKSIQIQTTFEPTVERVLGDAARLQQVMWNLLSNAVKFTPIGGRVEIRLERVDIEQAQSKIQHETAPQSSRSTAHKRPNPSSYAQIQFSDTGRGIQPDFLPHVFDRFRQADGTTTRTFGGLGLGLAIVRHLVELHGGTVQADSLGEGQGATFTVRLPLSIRETTAIERQENPITPPLTHAIAGIRVLLVDDDADTRDVIAFTLEQSGAIVTPVASAIEALQVFEQASFDLLMSDIGMPEMDGYMLIRQIRAMSPEHGGKIVAIALTAYAGEINQQQAIAAGFQQHVAKPVEPEHIVKLIALLVSKCSRVDTNLVPNQNSDG